MNWVWVHGLYHFKALQMCSNPLKCRCMIHLGHPVKLAYIGNGSWCDQIFKTFR